MLRVPRDPVRSSQIVREEAGKGVKWQEFQYQTCLTRTIFKSNIFILERFYDFAVYVPFGYTKVKLQLLNIQNPNGLNLET